MPFTDSFRQPTAADGRRFDFHDAAKWDIFPNIPVLDEHELLDDKGRPSGYVDASILGEIAENNNRRVHETGDPAPLIIGHTSDDPRAPERPVVGYAINYRVAPFKNGRAAIFVDYAVRKKYSNVIDDFPRRSVELWLNKRELDPIALLGGTTPERDLGVIVRNSRLKAISLLGSSTPERDLGVTLRYSRKLGGTVLRYAMEDTDMPHDFGGAPQRYAEGPPEGDEGDEGLGDGGDEFGDEGADEDPVVAKVLSSKPIKDLMGKVDEMYQALVGGGEGAPGGEPPVGPGGEPGMDDGMGMEGAPGGGGSPGMGAPPPGGPGGPGGAPPMDPEAARFHGAPPVRFEEDEPEMYAATGFAGPGSTSVPSFGGGKKPFSRNGNSNGSAKVNGTQTRQSRQQPAPRGGTQNPELLRMQRSLAAVQESNRRLVAKLARSEAEKHIAALKDEGIVFGDTPDDAAKNEKEEVDFLAVLDERDQAWQLSRIRRLYKRRAADPAQSPFGELARFSRPPDNTDPSDPNSYEPKTPQEAALYADALQKTKMDVPAAVKLMRSRSGRA